VSDWTQATVVQRSIVTAPQSTGTNTLSSYLHYHSYYQAPSQSWEEIMEKLLNVVGIKCLGVHLDTNVGLNVFVHGV